MTILSLRDAPRREFCGRATSGPPHSHKSAITGTHSSHCAECVPQIAIFWLRRAPEITLPQTCRLGDTLRPTKLIRSRVESDRAGSQGASGAMAGLGRVLSGVSRRPAVDFTTGGARRGGKLTHLPRECARRCRTNWWLVGPGRRKEQDLDQAWTSSHSQISDPRQAPELLACDV